MNSNQDGKRKNEKRSSAASAGSTLIISAIGSRVFSLNTSSTCAVVRERRADARQELVGPHRRYSHVTCPPPGLRALVYSRVQALPP